MKYLILILCLTIQAHANLIVFGNQTVNITGDMDIGYLVTKDNSIANLYNLTDKWAVVALMASDNSTVNLYVDSYVLSNSGGRYGTGYVYGNWANSVPFRIELGNGFGGEPDWDTASHLRLIVPEPATVLMLSMLILFRSKDV